MDLECAALALSEVLAATILGPISPETAKKWLGWGLGELYTVGYCGGILFCIPGGTVVMYTYLWYVPTRLQWRSGGLFSSTASSAPHPGGGEGGYMPFAAPRYRPELPPLSRGSGHRSAFPRLSWALRPPWWAKGRGRGGVCHRRQGSSYSFQRERSFATYSGFQGEVLVQILDFPIHSIHFHFSLSSR